MALTLEQAQAEPKIPEYYVMMISMSSDQMGKSKMLDDVTKELKFRFVGKERKKISSVRRVVDSAGDVRCPRFFDLKIANLKTKKEMMDIILHADKEMKKIAPDLHASVKFIPLPGLETGMDTGTLFSEMAGQIQGQIHQEVLSEINEAIRKRPEGELPKRTKDALISMLTKLSQLNIVKDRKIDESIEEMKKRVLAGEIRELKAEITGLLTEANKSRFSGIAAESYLDSTPAVAVAGKDLPDNSAIGEDGEPAYVTPTRNTTGSRVGNRMGGDT